MRPVSAAMALIHRCWLRLIPRLARVLRLVPPAWPGTLPIYRFVPPTEPYLRLTAIVYSPSIQALGLALRVARDGNPASASDAGVGGACALAAAEGAALNVRINLPSLTDEKAAAGIAAEQQRLLAQARELSGEVRDAVEQHLAP